MKLNQKTFIYSLIISFTIGTILILYMIFMVPSLYTDYKSNNNLQGIKEDHSNFVKQGKFKGEFGRESENSIGFKLDRKTYLLEFSSSAFEGSFNLGKSKVKDIIQDIERDFSNIDTKKIDNKVIEKNIEKYFNQLKDIVYPRIKDISQDIQNELDSKFKLFDDNMQFQNEKQKFHSYGKNLSIIQSGIENVNSNTEYVSYVAFSKTDDTYYISFASTLNPKPTEIQPVMLDALPVIIPMLVLLSLAISTIFSRKIVNPIQALSNDAKKRQYDDYKSFNPIEVKSKDEIGELAHSLNDLYLKQNESINKLESESKRKEIFMRSFSHQLKTPVATASLLVDSMISKVGKFADKEKYLPEVKKELNSMKKILADILEINNISQSQKIEDIDLYDLALRIKNNHHIELINKNLDFEIKNKVIWKADGDILYQIIDNLVKNAISYTGKSGQIKLVLEESNFSITNMPAKIEKDIREVMFEPFVTGNVGESGYGLGLYLVKYFTDLLNMEIEIEEKVNEVKFIVMRKEK